MNRNDGQNTLTRTLNDRGFLGQPFEEQLGTDERRHQRPKDRLAFELQQTTMR